MIKTSGIHFETIHKRKDGSEFYVEVNVQITTMDGKEVFTSIIRGHNVKKLSEQKLRDQEELSGLYLNNHQ